MQHRDGAAIAAGDEPLTGRGVMGHGAHVDVGNVAHVGDGKTDDGHQCLRVDEQGQYGIREAEISSLSVGPNVAVGLITLSSVCPPSFLMKSQAARSASTLDLT